MSAHGADMIVLRRCYSCGEWPYLHKLECPVTLGREREREELLAAMLAALFSSLERTGCP